MHLGGKHKAPAVVEKAAAEPAPAPKPPAVVAGPWLEAKRGETWIDENGTEMYIVGVVVDGFDTTSLGGFVVNWRLNRVPKDVIAAVSAWKRKAE